VNSLPQQLVGKTAHREASIAARKGVVKKT